jgi:hypothetical protein
MTGYVITTESQQETLKAYTRVFYVLFHLYPDNGRMQTLMSGWSGVFKHTIDCLFKTLVSSSTLVFIFLTFYKCKVCCKFKIVENLKD